MVLLSLKERRVREIKTVSGLFWQLKPRLEEIDVCDGDGIMLVLDGWDELPPVLRGKDSFFLDLLKGEVLSDATILVTSRPHASEIMLKACRVCIFQHIKITGFTEENIQTYIESNAGDDPKLLDGLLTYTAVYPHIKSMMYIPLNAAIVVKVYKDSWKEESAIPKTITELYSSLVRSLLLRYLTEHPVHGKRRWRLRQFSDLPSDVYQQLCQVSEIAYEGIVNEQQVIFTDLPDNFDHLGLMQCVPELYVDKGIELSYNFLHLTMQEYLAAYHMSLQPTERQVEVFQHHLIIDSNRMVLKFLAGLVNFRNFPDSTLSLLFTDVANTEDDCAVISLDGLHLLFEAKTCFPAIEGTCKKYILSATDLTAFDSFIVGYVASHTNCRWTIDMSCYREDKTFNEMKMFSRGTREDQVQFEATEANSVELILGVNKHAYASIVLGQLFVSHSSFLKRISNLTVCAVAFDFHSYELLCNSLCLLPHLQSLRLWEYDCESEVVRISPPSLMSLCSSALHPGDKYSPVIELLRTLRRCTALISLDLMCARIGQEEHEVLADWLSSPTCHLQRIYFRDKHLSNKPLVANLHHYHSLCELDLCNEFSYESLASVLKTNEPPITKLHFTATLYLKSWFFGKLN